MTNYTVNVAQDIIFDDSVKTAVIQYSLTLNGILIIIYGSILIISLIIFKHFFIKYLEDIASNKKIKIIICIIALIISTVLAFLLLELGQPQLIEQIFKIG